MKRAVANEIDHWKAVDGGFRGSLLLRVGAVAAAAGVLINLGGQLLGGAAGPSQPVTIVAWLLYIAALWLLAAGFIWVAANPFLTRFGFVVGALHAIQGIYLLVVLFTFTRPVVPAISLTVGRLVATLLFAILEKESLSRRTRRLLGGAAGLLLLKAISRATGLLPDFGAPIEPLLDAVFLLALAAAMFQLAAAVRLKENDWARTIHEQGNADFADFNNPEHVWNKGR